MGLFKRREKKPNGRIIILIDWENLITNIQEMPSPDMFSVTAGFDRLIRRIALEIGEIVNVFVFIPLHLAYNYAETFHKMGFFTVVCPKVLGKTEEEIDTTDETIINFGNTEIENTKGLTHLCIGSGDKDFSPLVRHAVRKGLKIVVVAGSNRSLANELIQLADKIFIFSPADS